MDEINTPRKRGSGRPLGYRTSTESDVVLRTRSALGLTQEDFAREIGCSVSTVAKMENEKRTPGTRALKNNLVRLAKRARVDLNVVQTVIDSESKKVAA